MKKNRHGRTNSGMNSGGLSADEVERLLANHDKALADLSGLTAAQPNQGPGAMRTRPEQTREQFKRYALGRVTLAGEFVPVQKGLMHLADQDNKGFQVSQRAPRVVYASGTEVASGRPGFRFPRGGAGMALRQRYVGGEIDAALGQAQFELCHKEDGGLQLCVRSGRGLIKTEDGLAISALVTNPDKALLTEREQVRRSFSSKPVTNPTFHFGLGYLYGHTRESAEEIMASAQTLLPETITLSSLAFLSTQPEPEYMALFSQT